MMKVCRCREAALACSAPRQFCWRCMRPIAFADRYGLRGWKLLVRVAFLTLMPSMVAAGQPRPKVPRSSAARLSFDFVQPVGVAILSDGSVAVADLMLPAVLLFDPKGALIWKRDRVGSGPGDVGRPYRLSTMANDRVLLFDIATKRFTIFERDGRVESSRRADIEFTGVNDVVTIGDAVVVAGVSNDSRAFGHSIHVLDNQLRWQRSFGDLPRSRDMSLLAQFGVGSLERASEFSMLFASKSVGPVMEFDLQGRTLRSYFRPQQQVTQAESAFVVTRLANGVRSIRQAPRLRVPTRAFAISPTTVLTGFADGANVRYSLASRSKAPTPISLHSTKAVVPLAFDQRRCQLIIRYNDSEQVPQVEVIKLPATIRSQLGSDNAQNERGPC
jgi:hypothetical protein